MVRKKTKKYWFTIGLVSIVMAAPNATVIKYTMGGLNPFVFNFIRFGLVALLALPYILKDVSNATPKNIKHALFGGMTMTIAVLSYVSALMLSPASYVSVITLITPIVFVIYSVKLTGEKINSRSIAGITLAALGAFLVVFLPIALSQKGDFTLYPLATALLLINSLTYPLAIIFFKKANEEGLSLGSLMGASALCTVVVSIGVYLLFYANTTVELTPKNALGIIYSGAVVAFLARILNIASYERIGSAVSSALAYLETFLAILIPVILFHEVISQGMVVGGALILFGTYLAEHHRMKHHKHHHFFRTH